MSTAVPGTEPRRIHVLPSVTEMEQRLECLKLAVQVDGTDPVPLAKALLRFVRGDDNA